MFHCFTHCNENFDIFELIQRVKKIEFLDSVSFINEQFNFQPNKSILIGFNSKYKCEDWEILDKYDYLYTEEVEDNNELKTYPNRLIELYPKLYSEEWVKDSISVESMAKFNIRFDTLNNRIIIPHYNIDNELVGIRCRNLNPSMVAIGNKYMPIKIEGDSYAHPLSLNLYGINETKKAIQKFKKAIIFESEKSVLQCDTYYGENNYAVACCGSHVTLQQRDLLLDLGIKEIYIALDKMYNHSGDDLSKNYIKKLSQIGDKFSPYVTTYILWDKENLIEYKSSPSDFGVDTLEKLIESKIEIQTENEVII